MNGFAECIDCNVWAYIPTGFNELKHFVICPKCNQPMYLVRNGKSSDVAYTDSMKVEGTIRKHGVKI